MKARRAWLLLLVLAVFIGIWLIVPTAGKVQITGPVSATDLKALRHELRRAQWGRVIDAAKRRHFAKAAVEFKMLAWRVRSVEGWDSPEHGKTAGLYLRDARLGDKESYMQSFTNKNGGWEADSVIIETWRRR
jgi:hypothetical protein